MLKLPNFTRSIAAAALTLAATPAMAQANSEEITVSGRFGDADAMQSLSHTVSYADLDLGTAAGRDELRQRVKLTARFLCNRLGEPEASAPGPGNIPSCREAATKDAIARVETIEQTIEPRGASWMPGQAWKAPYPAQWANPG